MKTKLLLAYGMPVSDLSQFAYLFLAFGQEENKPDVVLFIFTLEDAQHVQDVYWDRLSQDDQVCVLSAVTSFSEIAETSACCLTYEGHEAAVHYQTHRILHLGLSMDADGEYGVTESERNTKEARPPKTTLQ